MISHYWKLLKQLKTLKLFLLSHKSNKKQE